MKYFLIALLIFASGCATLSQQRIDTVWDSVNTQYGGNNTRPDVVIIDARLAELVKGRRGTVYGLYFIKANVILLDKQFADEDVLEHEFRHACGDNLGENVVHTARSRQPGD